MENKEKIATYEWVINIIYSCENSFQFEVAKKVIELFDNKYNDEHSRTQLELECLYHFKEKHCIIN